MGVRPRHLREGRMGERAACRFLMGLGYDILARRFGGRGGEIDLIAFEEGVLVFIEVKTRSSSSFGEPWEFVDWQKQRRIERTAEEFVARHGLGQYTRRYDIVSVIAPGGRCEEIALFRDAF